MSECPALRISVELLRRDTQTGATQFMWVDTGLDRLGKEDRISVLWKMFVRGDGQYRIRTCDPFRVKEVLYH